jgi:hypothetical protein
MKKTDTDMADDDMPEIDLKRAKIAGVGEYFRRMAAEQRYVQLDPDVAKVFGDSESVNRVLRAIIAARPSTVGKRRKSA